MCGAATEHGCWFVSDARRKVDAVQWLLGAHCIIFGAGLVAIVSSVARVVHGALITPLFLSINFRDWAQLDYPVKSAQLTTYVVAVITIFLYVAALVAVTRSKPVVSPLARQFWSSSLSTAVYFFGALLLNVLLFLMRRIGEEDLLVGLALVWLVWFLVPWTDQIVRRAEVDAARLIPLGAVLVMVMSIHLVWIFSPYVLQRIPIGNDYLDIPEQTLVADKYVDNHEFINSRNLFGLNKYNPLIDNGSAPVPLGARIIKIQDNELLSQFVAGSGGYKFRYDSKRGELIVSGQMTAGEFQRLIAIADSKKEEQAIMTLYLADKKRMERRQYTDEELEFLRKNQLGLTTQPLAGHYFHHHNQLTGVLNYLAVSGDFDGAQYLYGWGSTVLIDYLVKALGGLTFENYLSALYIFYPAYYLIFLVLVYFVFKQASYVAAGAVLAFGFLLLLGFQSIHFAPGFNPLRHFFDLFVLGGFVAYLRSGRFGSLILTLAFAALGVMANTEFGLVLFASLIATLVVRGVLEKGFSWRISVAIFAAITGTVLFLNFVLRGQGNPTLIYMLMGVSVPETAYVRLYFLTTVFLVGYFFLWRMKPRAETSLWYLSLLLFWYSQGSLLYYVWNPAPNHLHAIAPIWILSCLTFLALVLRVWFTTAQEGGVVHYLAFGGVLLLYLPAMAFYHIDRTTYYDVFDSHRVYQWTFNRAHIKTTMNPVPFENAISLIKKYSQDRLYLISKYDNLVPFLAERYSAMPFPEVALSLVSDRELKRCIDTIRRDRPEYLFVDTDVERDLSGDIYQFGERPIPHSEALRDASVGRVKVLSGLRDVFSGIRSEYDLLEQGFLISVYKRKSTPGT